jgi:hypothetical protein
MLAPLGYYMFAMVVMCTIFLLSVWAYDNGRDAIEDWRSRSADLGFGLESISGEWRPYTSATDEFGYPVEHWPAA